MKKTKFLAKALIVISLIIIVSISFSSCIYTRGSVNRTIRFKSHEDLVKFVDEYNSQNDGFVYTFVSFDFDNHENVHIYEYRLNTIWNFKRSKFNNNNIEFVKMYDKDHSKGFGFGCEMILHIDDITNEGDVINGAYQINCSFGTRVDYNFYQEDNMSVNYEACYYLSNANNVFSESIEIRSRYSNIEKFIQEFADVRTFNSEKSSCEEYYDYMYVYHIQINDKEEIRVQINSHNILTEEKQNELCQLLLNNIEIINTEG